MSELLKEFLKQTVSNLETLQNEFSLSEDFLRRYFRLLHTIKGTANTLNFYELANLAHRIEDVVQAIQTDEISTTDEVNSIIRESLELLSESARRKERVDLTDFLEKLRSIIPDKIGSDESYEFTVHHEIISKLSAQEKKQLNLAIQKGKEFYLLKAIFDSVTFFEEFSKFKEILNQNGDVIAILPDESPALKTAMRLVHVSDSEISELRQIIRDFDVLIESGKPKPMPENLAQLLQNLEDYGQKIAKSLGKKIAFETNFDNIQLSFKHLILINQIASHLLHNAIDHGIESAEERASKGKNITGKITISLEKLDSQLLFRIHDDGGGIDVEQITRIAAKKGLFISNDTDATELIFSPGFSTKETISSISGRGVGLDSVKNLVEKAGGKIDVQTTFGQKSIFSVHLPNVDSIWD